EERAAKAQNWKLPVCYDDDDDEERSGSLDENIIFGLPPFSAITPDEPTDNDSFSFDNIDYVEASPLDSELVSSEMMEIVIPDDQSCSDKDVLETIVSKPLCEEKIIPMKSLRTHDSSLLISSMIDSLLDEFAGELTLLKSISPGIDEIDCDFEEDIRLIENCCTITLLRVHRKNLFL
nr:hypothetical protein [Tanacetum cinerariifolium]